MNKQEELIKNRDFSRGSAERDKRRLKLDLALGGVGLFGIGVSTLGVVAGLPIEGSVGLIMSGFVGYVGTESLENDFKAYTASIAQVAQRELQIRQLES